MTRTGLDAIREMGDIKKEAVKEDPLRPREQGLHVKYTSPDGQTHEGTLLSKIMNNDERLEVNRIAARLAGVPWGQIPTHQAARIWALATVTVQLRDIPGWADTWIPEDDTLLFSLFNQCEKHASEFFRTGGGEGETGKAASRLCITPVVPTSASAE